MQAVNHEMRTGYAYALVGLVILSFDAMTIRYASDIGVGDNEIIFGRGAMIMLVMICFLLTSMFRSSSNKQRAKVRIDWLGTIIYSLIFLSGTICFSLSILNTYSANTLTVLAAAPLLATAGNRFILKQATPLYSWVAVLIVAVGISLIVYLSSQATDTSAHKNLLLGDLLALIVAVGLAAGSMLLRTRKKTSERHSFLFGGTIISVSFLFWGSSDALSMLTGEQFFALFLNGLIISLAFILIAKASKLISPPEITLLFLLETILGPLWIWFIFAEVPPSSTVIIATLIILVVGIHTKLIWDKSKQ